ncbi:type II secretion system protein E [Desulfarculus baarsii DSM 2075]|uniref:Type II secretion system protein E n=1 Tax=Desulfarculus baarsii (strain ATCC 33931 / DSM 2075 / LMG 7858 / VKM B-1802 / 2st14) TaxID=644282 RepID=E1QGL2_DESB2|nr:GspE/PulE family protein [Desulfarculus baarsii]ADK84705.1 type II secretion system protein E [Desulfarculus baarsii DSM 2075]
MPGFLAKYGFGATATEQEPMLGVGDGATGLLAPAQPHELAEAVAIEGLSYDFLKRYKILPMIVANGALRVAVCDEGLSGPLQALELFCGRPTLPLWAPEEAILRRLEVLYGLGSGGMGGLGQGADQAGVWALDDEALRDLSSEAPAIRLLNYLVDRAVAVGASDIHVEPYRDRVGVRFRIDGILHEKESFPKGFEASFVSRVKIMARMNITERRRPQDGQITLQVSGRDLDLRVSTLPSVFGESIVIRLLYRDTLGLELAGLGVGQDDLRRFVEMIERPHGLLLVTGPTGAGKTTTLYAALRRINSSEKKIITLEDPVEYQLPGVAQTQVNAQVGYTFASGLRSIVRQDPDVILVGEIRDRETAYIAIHAALTGHLVLSTLHTNDAASAITRLQDMGIDSFLISSALTGVLAQRLVRVLCPRCRQPLEVSGEVPRRRGLDEPAAKVHLWRPGGCPDCGELGYKGRMGIFELLRVSEPIRALIGEQAHSELIMARAVAEGMTRLIGDGYQKARQGLTSLDEVLRVTIS